MAARVVFMPVLAQLAPPLPHPAARLSHSPTPASRPLTLCPASAQQVPTWRCCLPLGASVHGLGRVEKGSVTRGCRDASVSDGTKRGSVFRGEK